ncbi:MAG TPA: hypothetical protein VFE98_04220 [Candidatus Bathyarchaeia archaeon]|nr:hypothetical protein [Candidatus Bathyarchaeia archaeon]
MEEFAQSGQSHESPDLFILRMLKDPVVSRLLNKSSLTRVQFEALLIDQLGDEIANRRLSRAEMAKIAHHGTGISRGALNRTLAQAKSNVSGAIHTLLLLGYSGILESPSLAPFVEASETLKSNTMLARESGEIDDENYERLVESLMHDLEEAAEGLRRRRRDM